MFYGLDWIATVPPTVRLTAQRFGPERANLVFGWIFAGHQLGAGVAAFGAGLSRTVLDTYLPAFFVAGALCIVAALITLAISRPKPVVAAAALANVIPGRCEASNYDAQLHTVASRDSRASCASDVADDALLTVSD